VHDTSVVVSVDQRACAEGAHLDTEEGMLVLEFPLGS
jgi:hypothetical protein